MTTGINSLPSLLGRMTDVALDIETELHKAVFRIRKYSVQHETVSAEVTTHVHHFTSKISRQLTLPSKFKVIDNVKFRCFFFFFGELDFDRLVKMCLCNVTAAIPGTS